MFVRLISDFGLMQLEDTLMAIIFFMLCLLLCGVMAILSYYTIRLKTDLAVCEERCQNQFLAHQRDIGKLKEAYVVVRQQNKKVLDKYAAKKLAWRKADDVFRERLKALSQYQGILDADKVAAERRDASLKQVAKSKDDASQIIAEATETAKTEISAAKEEASRLRDETEAALNAATLEASEIIRLAEVQAEEIGGSAYEAKKNAALYEKTVRAMKNRIKGYGDEYIVPEQGFLDDLADDFGFTDAGRQLKLARDRTRMMLRNGTAADCDYVETNRKQTAINFVLDAFNGKVDTILSRTKHDNAGKLQQAIRDSFNLVNYNGQAFRSARIRDEYLKSRLEELRWGEIAQQIKMQDREEQRAAKQLIREEAKVAREQARALKEAAKEEEKLEKALLQVRQQFAEANGEQREMYEQRLKDMEARLEEAHQRKERARSMAEQTKKGYVYIISNIGSFGENLFKIGLTRRDDPMDRVKELGDSSVPFGFDVHAMILSDDAPALEYQLHKHFVLHQVNKVNHRKEFFKVPLQEIRGEIDSMNLTTGVKWTMTAEARDFRESLAIESAFASDPNTKEKWINRQLRSEGRENNIGEMNSNADSTASL